MELRAAVASGNFLPLTATTERGPPDHPKACAQNAHKLRRTRLIPSPCHLPEGSSQIVSFELDSFCVESGAIGVLENAVLNTELWAKPSLAQNTLHAKSVNLLSPPKRRFETIPSQIRGKPNFSLYWDSLSQHIGKGLSFSSAIVPHGLRAAPDRNPAKLASRWLFPVGL